MVRSANDSLAPEFRPPRPPSGSGHFGNLLRDPSLAMQELVASRLALRGYEDLRPALLAVGQHMRADGSRITELAERALLTKATVVHAVDELERLGYATRRPDPSDGRAKLVALTERGLAAEAVGREAVADIREAWAQHLGRREMDELEARLRRLHEVLWPEEAEPAG